MSSPFKRSSSRVAPITVAPRQFDGSGESNQNGGLATGDENNTQGGPTKVSSAVVGDICHVFGPFFALFVRLLLVTFSLFTVWLVVYNTDENLFWLLSAPILLIVVEGIHIVYKRGGQERKWVCVCFIFYLLSVIPSIWILELDRMDIFENEYGKLENGSNLNIAVSGLSADIQLETDTLLTITEQCLLFLLILTRWLLPRGEITRDQLSQLLFVFIGMASDVMELFQLFEEKKIREDELLTYIILSVWTISLFQFCLVLTMSYSPKKPRPAGGQHGESDEGESPEERRNCCTVFIQSEIWSLVVSITMQDGPFLAVRMYALVKHDLMTYSIIFYCCKNILVILLLVYRFAVLMLKEKEDREKIEDNGYENYSTEPKQRSKDPEKIELTAAGADNKGYDAATPTDRADARW